MLGKINQMIEKYAEMSIPFTRLVTFGSKVKVKCTTYIGTETLYRPYSSTLSWPRHYKGVSGQLMPRSLFTPGKGPVPIVQEAGWAPAPVWTGAENLSPTGIRSLGRPARSQSLYRLRYAALFWVLAKLKFSWYASRINITSVVPHEIGYWWFFPHI